MGLKSNFTPDYQNFFDFEIQTLWCQKPIAYYSYQKYLKTLTIYVK